MITNMTQTKQVLFSNFIFLYTHETNSFKISATLGLNPIIEKDINYRLVRLINTISTIFYFKESVFLLFDVLKWTVRKKEEIKHCNNNVFSSKFQTQYRGDIGSFRTQFTSKELAFLSSKFLSELVKKINVN